MLGKNQSYNQVLIQPNIIILDLPTPLLVHPNLRIRNLARHDHEGKQIKLNKQHTDSKELIKFVFQLIPLLIQNKSEKIPEILQLGFL
jgi:hypothetical protein